MLELDNYWVRFLVTLAIGLLAYAYGRYRAGASGKPTLACAGLAGALLGHDYQSVTVDKRQGELLAEVYLGESCTRCAHWVPHRPEPCQVHMQEG